MEIRTWRKFPILLLGLNVTRWEDGTEESHDPAMSGLHCLVSSRYEGPADVQYWSRFGFMLTWPLCFSFWIQFRPQTEMKNENGDLVRVAGTERVIYFRIGIRWDALRKAYELPSLFIGGHFD